MAGFPLFRLPLLPLKNVLDEMNLDELTMLYLCSEKTQNVLKATKKTVSIDSLSNDKKQKLNAIELITLFQLEKSRRYVPYFPKDSIAINIIITDKLKITLNCTNGYQNKFPGCFPLSIEIMDIHCKSMFAGGPKNNLKSDGVVIPVQMWDKRTMLTFWKDVGNGLNTLVTYFMKFFNTRIKEYFIYGCRDSKFSQNLRTAVKVINQETIESCEVKYDINSEDYKYILDNIKPTNSFELSVCGEPANWFTFDNLITMNCKYIDLKKSVLTDDGLCKYLKLWMDGKFEKLKCLTVELRESVNLDYIFSKLRNYGYTFQQERDIIRIKQHGTLVANFQGFATILGYTNKIRFDIL